MISCSITLVQRFEGLIHRESESVKSLSHVRLFATPWTVACTRLLRPWDFLGKSTGMGCHFLLQGIFLTQGLNTGLPHCRQTLYHLSHHREETYNGLAKLQNTVHANKLRTLMCQNKKTCTVYAYTPYQKTLSTTPLLAKPQLAPHNDSHLAPS